MSKASVLESLNITLVVRIRSFEIDLHLGKKIFQSFDVCALESSPGIEQLALIRCVGCLRLNLCNVILCKVRVLLERQQLCVEPSNRFVILSNKIRVLSEYLILSFILIKQSLSQLPFLLSQLLVLSSEHLALFAQPNLVDVFRRIHHSLQLFPMRFLLRNIPLHY